MSSLRRALPLRTLLLLEEVAASRNPAGPNHERAPYLTLARHLPFRPAAIAAIALLERRRQGGHAAADTWTTVHGIEVASGLLKHTAVRADPVAALRQLQPRGESRASRCFHLVLAWLWWR